MTKTSCYLRFKSTPTFFSGAGKCHLPVKLVKQVSALSLKSFYPWLLGCSEKWDLCSLASENGLVCKLIMFTSTLPWEDILPLLWTFILMNCIDPVRKRNKFWPEWWKKYQIRAKKETFLFYTVTGICKTSYRRSQGISLVITGKQNGERQCGKYLLGQVSHELQCTCYPKKTSITRLALW